MSVTIYWHDMQRSSEETGYKVSIQKSSPGATTTVSAGGLGFAILGLDHGMLPT